MKSISKLSVLLMAFVFSLAALQAGTVSAHEGEEHETVDIAQQEDKEEEKEESSVSYKYVAQPGDSYTLIARKAVQTYGLKENVDLSGGQIIFAETKLTQAAGSPELSVGQEVTVDESAVADAVKQARELSEEREALWGEYAAGADFNTDNVGEAQSEENEEAETEENESAEENSNE